jgi:hypothetical protein
MEATRNSIAVFGMNQTTVNSVAQAHCSQYGKIAQVHDTYWGETIFHCVEE